ncbi:MAG: hypothetical protein PW788_05185 [Micavibrio sp.]|nr:hypothetical protein [Micavibrio sp.]
MKKLLRMTAAVVIFCGVSAFDSKATIKFPGYAPVMVNGAATDYLYEPDTVTKIHGGKSFKLVHKLSDGYIMQKAQVDCRAKISYSTGTYTSYDGKDEHAYEGSKTAFGVSADSSLQALSDAVCGKTTAAAAPAAAILPLESGLPQDMAGDLRALTDDAAKLAACNQLLQDFHSPAITQGALDQTGAYLKRRHADIDAKATCQKIPSKMVNDFVSRQREASDRAAASYYVDAKKGVTQQKAAETACSNFLLAQQTAEANARMLNKKVETCISNAGETPAAMPAVAPVAATATAAQTAMPGAPVDLTGDWVGDWDTSVAKDPAAFADASFRNWVDKLSLSVNGKKAEWKNSTTDVVCTVERKTSPAGEIDLNKCRKKAGGSTKFIYQLREKDGLLSYVMSGQQSTYIYLRKVSAQPTLR